MGDGHRCVARLPPRTSRTARPSHCPRLARGHGSRPAVVRVRHCRRHQKSVRRHHQCAGGRSPRTVGRFGRSGRVQQHLHCGREEFSAGGNRNIVTLWSGYPLRYSRARHGSHHQWHRPRWPHAALLRDFPGVQRLHARRRSTCRVDADTEHLCVDARLHRPR